MPFVVAEARVDPAQAETVRAVGPADDRGLACRAGLAGDDYAFDLLPEPDLMRVRELVEGRTRGERSLRHAAHRGISARHLLALRPEPVVKGD